MLLRLILKDLNKWKIMHCSWVKCLNIVKMSNLAKFIYRCNNIPFRIPEVFKTYRLIRWFLKFIWKCGGPRLVKKTLKKAKLEDISDVKVYYKGRQHGIGERLNRWIKEKYSPKLDQITMGIWFLMKVVEVNRERRVFWTNSAGLIEFPSGKTN